MRTPYTDSDFVADAEPVGKEIRDVQIEATSDVVSVAQLAHREALSEHSPYSTYLTQQN